MSYLVMKSSPSATPESFQLTNTCNKPRLVVSGSYIPLTNTGGGSSDLKVKDNNGNTYRAMRTSTSSYSQSASGSATYLTSSDQPGNMSNITNLTKVSTSNTVYLTNIQTTRTEYVGITGESTLYYTSHQTELKTVTYTNKSASIRYLTNHNVASAIISSSMTYTQNKSSVLFVGAYFRISESYSYYYYMSEEASKTSSKGTSITIYPVTKSETSNYLTVTNTLYLNTFIPCDEHVSTCTSTYDVVSSPSQYSSAFTHCTLHITTSTNNFVVTGTIYHTAVVTTNTIYETRPQTTGYSGISSSSSSSSESASSTCWK